MNLSHLFLHYCSDSIIYRYWIFVLLTLTGFALTQEITTPPVDITGAIGENAKLQCKVQFGSIQAMTWEYNEIIIIYSFQDGEEHYPLKNNKYSVTSREGHFTLWIKNLTYSDAGKYTCATIIPSESAILVVLDRPHLSVAVKNSVEGTRAIYVCTGHFGRPDKEVISPEQDPKLQILFDGKVMTGTVQKEITENATLTYFIITQILNITLKASMNGKELLCDFGTSSPQMHMHATIKLEVLYSVRNIAYFPNTDSYNIGSVINCTANANPEPQFQWTDKTTMEVIKGYSLEITNQMVGVNKMQCTAMNTIDGVMYNISVLADFEVLRGSNGNDSWKIAVGITVPLLVGIGCFIALYYICIRRRKKFTPIPQQENIKSMPRSEDKNELVHRQEDELRRLEKYITQGKRNRYIDKHRDVMKISIISAESLLERLASTGLINESKMNDIKESVPDKRKKIMIQTLKELPDTQYFEFLKVLAESQEDLVKLLTGNEWRRS